MNAADLLSRVLPFLHESAQPYEDDGSNEPLELARDIEAFREEGAAALNQQAGVVEALEELLDEACSGIAICPLTKIKARAALAAAKEKDRA